MHIRENILMGCPNCHCHSKFASGIKGMSIEQQLELVKNLNKIMLDGVA